jgi:hypothetical protein
MLATAASSQSDPMRIQLGERIYCQGLLADGTPLSAVVAGNSENRGAAMACVQCHRRSGMGSREGEIRIPPIIGPSLYAKPAPRRPVRVGRQPAALLPTRQDA